MGGGDEGAPVTKMHCGYAVWRKWVKIGTPPLLLLSTGSEANMVIYIATYSLMMALCSQVHFVAAMRYLLFSLICLSAMPSACNTYHSTPSQLVHRFQSLRLKSRQVCRRSSFYKLEITLFLEGGSGRDLQCLVPAW